MEQISVGPKKSEARSRLRICFRNNLFSQVPFEIWKDIVFNSEEVSIVVLSKTCSAFQELVKTLGEEILKMALFFRKEDKIDVAREFLLKAANIGNATAMFYLGYAISFNGWKLKGFDSKTAYDWFRKSAELGNAKAMAHYAASLKIFNTNSNKNLYDLWGKKALQSNDSYSHGLCYLLDLGTSKEKMKAFACFELSANEGDEFGQYQLAEFFCSGHYVVEQDYAKAFYWYLKAAKQGHSRSQYSLWQMLFFGRGCVVDEEKSMFWKQKYENQSRYGL